MKIYNIFKLKNLKKKALKMKFSKEDIQDPEENTRTLEDLTFLTLGQLQELTNEFQIPYNGIDMVVDSYNKQLRRLTFCLFEDIKIYSANFETFKKKLSNTFKSSLIEPGTPIGAITSDAIGQQATQALLNTFHSVGTAKSGGPDGIKENITLSANRKILYSILHMRNGKMTFAEMMELKRKYIGISVASLFASPPESTVVDIREEFNINPFNDALSLEDKKKIFTGPSSWWYNVCGFDGVFDLNQQIPSVRTCLRLKLDIQKLYEYRITTRAIAAYINKWKFQFVIPKRLSKSATKRETEDHYVLAIPSPTHIGIIDIFARNYADVEDHLLISLIHGKEFENLLISGIGGISNFYAVSTPVSRLIRNVAKTSRFDDEIGNKGMWIYLDSNRFTGIPYSRLLTIMDNAGIKYQIPYFNNPTSYLEKSTDLPCEFISHKSVPELRNSFMLRGYLFGNMTEHQTPGYNMTQFVNGTPTIVRVNQPMDHYTHEKLTEGFEVSLYPYSQASTFDGPVSTKKFKSKDELVSFIGTMEYRLTYGAFINLFHDNHTQFETYFKTQDTQFKIVAFDVEGETNGNFIIYYLFQMRYIDYQINTNLDYVNSRYVTQSLDSMLSTHFWIPYEIANQGGVSLPNVLRQYRLRDIKKIEVPERRILVKSKMFLTDRYDFMGQPFRKIIIDYIKSVSNDATELEKIELVRRLGSKHHEILTEDDIKSIMTNVVLNPADRFLSFITERNPAEEMNYIYAETSGCNYLQTVISPGIAGHRTICNHFRQVYEVAGLEGLKNCQNNDMIGMINSSGYIAVEYMNFLTNVTTFNGLNPMTSQGILCQDRDWLAMTTFDSAAKYIKTAAMVGKEQSTYATSTCIFLGKPFEMGTGFVKVKIDKSKLNISNRQIGISEAFLKLSGIAKPIGDLFNDTSEIPLFIPKMRPNKFPVVPWVYENFIERDIIFYIRQGIDEFKAARLQFYESSNCEMLNEFTDMDSLLIKVVPSVKVLPK